MAVNDPMLEAASDRSVESKSRVHGWRIDYILVSRRLLPNVSDAQILFDYYGSDHVPIVATIDGL